MKILDAAVIVFEVSEVGLATIEVRRTKARKDRLFFVGIVATAAVLKIVKGGGYRSRFFLTQGTPGSLLCDQAEDMQKSFNATVAVLKHPQGIVEAAIWFCTNLHAHIFAL